MTPDTVVTVGQQALYVVMTVVALILLPALGVGLLVAMFQAATQINEQTLSFIPKLFVVFGVLFTAGPWILSTIIDFTERLIHSIPVLIG